MFETPSSNGNKKKLIKTNKFKIVVKEPPLAYPDDLTNLQMKNYLQEISNGFLNDNYNVVTLYQKRVKVLQEDFIKLSKFDNSKVRYTFTNRQTILIKGGKPFILPSVVQDISLELSTETITSCNFRLIFPTELIIGTVPEFSSGYIVEVYYNVGEEVVVFKGVVSSSSRSKSSQGLVYSVRCDNILSTLSRINFSSQFKMVQNITTNKDLFLLGAFSTKSFLNNLCKVSNDLAPAPVSLANDSDLNNLKTSGYNAAINTSIVGVVNILRCFTYLAQCDIYIQGNIGLKKILNLAVSNSGGEILLDFCNELLQQVYMSPSGDIFIKSPNNDINNNYSLDDTPYQTNQLENIYSMPTTLSCPIKNVQVLEASKISVLNYGVKSYLSDTIAQNRVILPLMENFDALTFLRQYNIILDEREFNNELVELESQIYPKGGTSTSQTEVLENLAKIKLVTYFYKAKYNSYYLNLLFANPSSYIMAGENYNINPDTLQDFTSLLRGADNKINNNLVLYCEKVSIVVGNRGVIYNCIFRLARSKYPTILKININKEEELKEVVKPVLILKS